MRQSLWWLRQPIFGVILALVVVSQAFAQSIEMTDVTSESGITFQHSDGSGGRYFIVETMSAGVALFDYDLDGDIDIYFLNGAPQPGSSTTKRPTNRLYRNDGQWRFTDVTDMAGVGDPGHGLGVSVGDYDNDGDPDLYINNFGPNILYRNDGNGKFTDVTEVANVGNGNRVGAGVVFLDIEGDGDLDLFAANYIRFAHDRHIPRTKKGYSIYGSPADYPAETNTLFRNNGDGTFTDISDESGIGAHAAPGMGVVSADYDFDGDSDIFVANDGQMNFLFQNDGRGKFKEVGLLSGFAYDASGRTHASMGVDCADFDNDGFLDFHVTSFQGEMATLYRNVGGKLLEDVTSRSGAGIGTRAPVTWGNGFVDFDNDGDRDLYIACGHLYDTVEEFDQSATYETPNLLFENQGEGRYANISRLGGQGMRVRGSSRGAAFDDLDNDGDIDAVVLNLRGTPTLLRNDSQGNNRWIDVKLEGKVTNRDGVGARVKVTADDLVLYDELHSGRGYQGHHGSRLHFGIGKRDRVDQIEVNWLGGGTTVLRDLAPGQVITVRESAAGAAEKGSDR
ncbi:MAG: CRTAC1 family protein [Planctomycetaceae bacterium]|nr:CRTAC1 family protein [Planctomycetaceae bacterium]